MTPEYPTQQVTWILRKLVGDPRSVTAFFDELDAVLDDARAGRAGLGDLLTLLEDWVTSLRLQQDPEWRLQMASSQADQLHA